MFSRKKPTLQLRSKWDVSALKIWYSVWRRVPGWFSYWEYVGGSFDEKVARQLFDNAHKYGIENGAVVIEQV